MAKTRNTNNSNKSANDNADNNDDTGEGVEAGDATNNNTLPQPAPAPNIQETAATDNGFVSQHEFNLLRDSNNLLRDRLSNVEANMTGINNSMNALNNSIVDAISQLSARFDSFENRLNLIEGGSNGNNTRNGNNAINIAADSTAPRFLGIHMRPAGMGDAISEMDSPSAIMPPRSPIDVTSNASSHLTSIPPIICTVPIQFVQSNLVQVIENQPRNIDSTDDARIRTSLKKECKSIGPMDCSVQ